MPLVQKNVTVPQHSWDLLRRQARASGAPLCIYLTYLIEQSHPIPLDDREKQEELRRIEDERRRLSSD